VEFRLPPASFLLPYTTLFRSGRAGLGRFPRPFVAPADLGPPRGGSAVAAVRGLLGAHRALRPDRQRVEALGPVPRVEEPRREPFGQPRVGLPDHLAPVARPSPSSGGDEVAERLHRGAPRAVGADPEDQDP